jgi:branched-subunit amino acid transport protein AzlD
MPDPHYLFAAVLVASAITWALRAVPFALLAPLRHSDLIRFLGDHSPVGVMIALVGYTPATSPGSIRRSPCPS